MKTKTRKPDIDYAITCTRTRNRQQDAAFYVDGYGHTWAATVTFGGNAVHVYADGEMRVTYLTKDIEMREAGDLLAAGITSDAKLRAVERAGKLEWHNNAWFDLYDADSGQHLECVCDCLGDAVSAAMEMLTGDYYHGCDNCGDKWAELDGDSLCAECAEGRGQ